MTIEILPTEQQEHFALMNWIRTQPQIRDLIIHIPNEGRRDIKFGNKLKRMGMRAGVSDFFLPYPTRVHHGLWLELKRKKGSKESDEQKAWIHRMRLLDYCAVFAYGWEDAREIILLYLSGNMTGPQNAA